jgi:hypothetical protein
MRSSCSPPLDEQISRWIEESLDRALAKRGMRGSCSPDPLDERMERLERRIAEALERHERPQENAKWREKIERMIEESLDRALASPFYVLGISADASKDEIARAYRRLAAKYHPDRGGATESMQRINAARDALL